MRYLTLVLLLIPTASQPADDAASQRHKQQFQACQTIKEKPARRECENQAYREYTAQRNASMTRRSQELADTSRQFIPPAQRK